MKQLSILAMMAVLVSVAWAQGNAKVIFYKWKRYNAEIQETTFGVLTVMTIGALFLLLETAMKNVVPGSAYYLARNNVSPG